MNNFELGILDFIRNTFACPVLDFLMPLITKLGDHGIFCIALSLLLICFKKTRKTGITIGVSLAIGFLVGNIFLKNVVGRIRPYDLNPNVDLLVAKLHDFSFPSGHTLACFETAGAIFLNNKKFGVAALILAALVAFSRLYLYVHYPTDVLAGIVLGIGFALLAGLLVNKAYKKINNKKPKV